VSADGELWAIRVKEPGMKIGVLLSSDGTLVNRWVHAAAMPREQADRIAAQIRAEGDEAKVVPFGPKPRRRRGQ
jgi:hypothetical protein